MAHRNELLKLLQRFEDMFHGTFSIWKTDSVEFELKMDVNSILLRPYPVPKMHKKLFKKEVHILFLLGFLEIAKSSEWAAA